MKATEKSNTKDSEGKPVLFYDRELYEASLSELKQQIETAKYLAEIWVSAGNLPPLTGELFRRWVQQPDLIFSMYQQRADEEIDKQYWPGASQQMTDKFQLKLDDTAKTERYLKSIESPVHRPEVFFSTNWISFESGLPYISDETMETLKAKCTIADDPEIQDAIRKMKQFAEIYNYLKNFSETKAGRSINLSDMPGFEPTAAGLTVNVSAMLREFFFKSDADYKLKTISTGNGAPAEKTAPVKIPADW